MNRFRKIFSPFSGGTLFVGFSGGADSTAALLVASSFQAELNFRLVAVHFAHGLRGAESENEAENAACFARKRSIEFLRIDLDLNPALPGLEERARTARLEAWKKLCSSAAPPGAVVTGHHADDRTENLLLMLTRGANASGASAMREHSEVEGVVFLRPLISWSRKEIEDFLRANAVETWACDSSNAENFCSRNLLRNTLLPELYARLPGAEAGLRAAVEHLECDARFIENCAEKRLKNGDPADRLFWKNMDPALLPRILRLYLKELCGTDLPVPPGVLARFSAECGRKSAEPRRIPAGHGLELEVRGDLLRLLPPETSEPPTLWNWKRNDARWKNFIFRAERRDTREADSPECVYFDGAELPGELEISVVRPGDRMIPFGRTGAERIKKLRCDRGLPSRPPLPLLRSGDSIYWAPFIRRSALAPVTERTREIWRFEILGE